LIKALIFLGAFEAAYGIVQYLTGWQKIFTFQKLYNLRQATGTYINYNHFAGLLELTIPFVLASAFYSIQVPAQHHSAREGRGVVGRHHPRRYQAFFYLFLLMIMVVAVFFSHSKMGILATLFSVIAISLLAHLRATGKVWLGMIAVFLLGALGYGLWIGIGPVLTRFESLAEPSALQAAGRLSIWRDGLRLIQDYPVTGSGLGTFGIAFRRFQTTMVNAHVDHAHNDYLELTADTGLVGVALLFLPVLFLLIKMIASFLHDSSHYRRAVTLGCIGSVLSILIHSTTDFNLQIPANALTFAVVLGIGYKAGYLESAPKNLAPPSPAAATHPWPG
jgi:O-antigen ligase